MNTSETAEVLRLLQTAHPHAIIDDDLALMWDAVFSGNPGNEVKHAVNDWLRNEGTFPKPAEIKTRMRELATVQTRDMSWTNRPDPKANPVPLSRGRQVAADAYQADCERRGVEPDWDSWNISMGITKLDRSRGKLTR